MPETFTQSSGSRSTSLAIETLGVFYAATLGPPDDTRVADVVLIEEAGERCLFHVAGRRLEGRVALARPVAAA